MQYTEQEAFDKALAGIRAQGYAPSYDPDVGCLYRGPGGTKCAFGFLIPDELYIPRFEGISASDLMYPESTTFEFDSVVVKERHAELAAMFGRQFASLRAMQVAHDEMLTGLGEGAELFDKPVGDRAAAFEARAKSIAQRYNLVYTDPETAEA